MTKYIRFSPVGEMKERIQIVDLDGWEQMTENLGCDLIEYAPVMIGKKPYSLIVDDEGLCHEPIPPVSSLYRDKEGAWRGFTYGPCLITPPADGEGNDVDVAAEDVDNLMDNMLSMMTKDEGGRLMTVIYVNFDFNKEEE